MRLDPPPRVPGWDRTAEHRPIRLLIVDDSLVVRTILARTLEAHAGFEVVGAAPNADQALEILGQTQVDIILLDVQMPGRDGLTALPEMLEKSAGARILVVSALCDSGASASIQAMALGAVDTLLKPNAGSFGTRFAETLIDRLVRIGPVPDRAAPSARPAKVPLKRAASVLRAPVDGPIGCLAIGASTGGIHALAAFFERLPRSFSAPILVTQHLPGSFMPYFAGQLREMTGRDAEVARDGARLERSCLFVAPGDAHLRLRESWGSVRVVLDTAPAPSGCSPSVDPMLEAVGAVYGAAGMGVVLSGMGRDGAIGAASLVAAGGEVLAQDPDSSVIWGMPGAVARAGLAAMVAPPTWLADRIAARDNQSEPRAWS
jgi:two-component system chemotaxis response regulator CheB